LLILLLNKIKSYVNPRSCRVGTSIYDNHKTSYLTQIVLNTTAKLHHRTILPTTATKEAALQIFRNHDILIRLDPELLKYEAASREPTDSPATFRYTVTDAMHTLPAGLWDTSVSFKAVLTNIDNGVEWIIQAPLGLVQKSLWKVEEAEEKDQVEGKDVVPGQLVLVEDIEIKCSRLLMGTVKGKCEQNWKGVHERWVAKLNELNTSSSA